jgi:hypothetical protein
MTTLKELREKAMAAEKGNWIFEYVAAVNPQIILQLLDDLEIAFELLDSIGSCIECQTCQKAIVELREKRKIK